MIYLSFTACKRYERCGELARQWKLKLVAEEVNQKPFFVGRVVHTAFERWMAGGGSLATYLPAAWAEEEAALVAKGPFTLRWVEGERDAEFQRAVTLAGTLEADAAPLRAIQFQSEPRLRFEITDAVGMYAQPDLLGEASSRLWVVELKSGKTFDPAQVDWYAAVVTVLRRRQGLPELPVVGVSLRPMLPRSVETREITKADMLAQIERAHRIGSGMAAGIWEAHSQGFCASCEGRALCPDFQGKYGRLTSGRVGL